MSYYHADTNVLLLVCDFKTQRNKNITIAEWNVMIYCIHWERILYDTRDFKTCLQNKCILQETLYDEILSKTK